MLSGPNLFTHAPSELSQDAFLAWLLEWADAAYAETDPALHRTGRRFVEALLAKAGRSVPAYRSVIVKTQHAAPFDGKAGAIDVFATLDEAGAILIEDKVRAGTHGDQLHRYRSWAERKYGEGHVAALYLKTHDQASYQNAEGAGFKPFRRSDLLAMLGEGAAAGVRNDIFAAFHAHLRGIEERVAAYAHTPIADWPEGHAGRDLRTGFFLAVQEVIPEARWNYVNNANGGFMGLWWGFEDHDGSRTYLQLEDDRLAFRISVDEKGRRRSLRHHWHERIIAAANEAGLPVQKPRRFGYGRTMRVAELPSYLQADTDGLLDLDATLATLRTAEAVLEQARADSTAPGA